MARGRRSEAEARNLSNAYGQVYSDVGSGVIAQLILTTRGQNIFDSLLMAARKYSLGVDMVSYDALLNELREKGYRS